MTGEFIESKLTPPADVAEEFADFLGLPREHKLDYQQALLDSTPLEY